MEDAGLSFLAEDILDEVYRRGRAAEPRVSLEQSTWARAAAPWLRLARDAKRTHVSPARVDEVFLAVAAVGGDATATTRIEMRSSAVVRAALTASGTAAQDHDDIMQQALARLFVAPPAEPARVLRYVGHGDLVGLIKVTAIRLALNAARGTDDVQADEAMHAVADGLDVELAAIERRYRAEFKHAFEAAIAALSAEDRNLLRLHIVDGLSIDHLARLLQIHRSTAARRTAKVRGLVAGHVRDSLVAQLGDGAAVQSVLRLVRSRLDLSLSRVLAPPSAPPKPAAGDSGHRRDE